MNKTTASRWLCTLTLLSLAATAGAQEMTITNARILDGTGKVIERGSIVVQGGKIASVAAGAPARRVGRVIDAGGKTVLPGYIDAHRHVVTGNPAEWLDKTAPKQLQEFLDAGFTTVLGAIDPPQLIEARRRIEAGTLKGPRFFVGQIIPLAGQAPPPPAAAGAPAPPRVGNDPARTDPARRPLEGQSAAPAIPREVTLKMIQAAKAAGYDYLKTIMNATPGGPEIETQKFVVAEGQKIGMPTITHAVSIRDTLAALEGKPALLVHTPHIGDLGADPAAVKKIVDAHIPMTSTLQVFLPHFGADGKPLFRDRAPFPFDTLSSAGQGPVNARLLWEAGMKDYGYGTDTQWPPKETLFDELRALSLVFSPADIVTILTKNAGIATMHGSEIGTLEAGKLADIVIVDGDPLLRTADLLNVVTTIKGGVVAYERK
jgi:imidazolonepropionase-like amidohydrolase